MRRFVFFLVVLFGLFSCEKDGVYKEHYDNGKVKSISIYKKGMRIHQKDFYQNGNTKHIESYLIVKEPNGKKRLTRFETKDWYPNGLMRRVIIKKPNTDITIYSASWDTFGRKNGEWKWICDKKYYAIEKYKKGMLLDSFSTDLKNKRHLEKELFTHCEKPKALNKICLIQEGRKEGTKKK